MPNNSNVQFRRQQQLLGVYRQCLKSNAKLSLATSGLSTQQICPTAAQVVCIQKYESSDTCSFIISSVNKGDAKLEWSLGLYSGGLGHSSVPGRGRRSLLVSGAHARPLTHLRARRRRRADDGLVTPRLANQPANSRTPQTCVLKLR